MRFPIVPGLCGAFAVLLACGVARGEDFHVESKVYVVGDKNNKPITETTTIFYQGIVYDFLKHPGEIRDPESTIFDPAGQRFIVLDPQRKLSTEISLKDTKEFLGQVRLQAAGHKDPILNFLSNPEFSEKEDKDQLEFTSAWMIYRLKTMPAKSDEIARQYGEFSHWHGQFNVMINPSSLPPFGRMAISKTLEERRLLPLEVYMTISPKGPQKKLVMRAEHRFQWTILETDRQSVSDAQRQMKLFRQVSLKEYNERLKDDPKQLTQASQGKPARK